MAWMSGPTLHGLTRSNDLLIQYRITIGFSLRRLMTRCPLSSVGSSVRNTPLGQPSVMQFARYPSQPSMKPSSLKLSWLQRTTLNVPSSTHLPKVSHISCSQQHLAHRFPNPISNKPPLIYSSAQQCLQTHRVTNLASQQ